LKREREKLGIEGDYSTTMPPKVCYINGITAMLQRSESVDGHRELAGEWVVNWLLPGSPSHSDDAAEETAAWG